MVAWERERESWLDREPLRYDIFREPYFFMLLLKETDTGSDGITAHCLPLTLVTAD